MFSTQKTLFFYIFIVFRVLNEYRNGLDENAGHLLDEFPDDIQDHFLKLGDVVKIRSNTRNLVGLSTDKNNAMIAWFNNKLYHTAPIALNLLHNAIVKVNLGSNHSITVSNWPVPYRPESKTLMTMNGDDIGSQMGSKISFAMAFIMALYIMFHIRERSSKAKLLQFISGVKASIFWIASFLFDFATYILISLVFMITVNIFHEKHWSTFQELMELLAVLIIFGLSSLAVTFVLSFVFTHASYGLVTTVILFVFTGKFCF